MITKFQIHELFPNSKTIDKHRDITVYHGSHNWFQDFDLRKLSSNTKDFLSMIGFHFTTDKKVAESFTKSYPKNHGQILTIYLHMNKTLKLTEHELVLGIIKYLMTKGHDFGDFEKLKELVYYDTVSDYTLYTELQNFFSYEDNEIKRGVNNFKKNVLLKNGYDSIEYLNQIEIRRKNSNRYDFISLKLDILEVDYNRIERF